MCRYNGILIAVLVFVILYSPSFVSGEAVTGYDVYSNWDSWARLKPGVRSGLASSYDRSGGNADYSHYEFPEGLVTEETGATVKTIEGPGMLYRFWMPHVMGRRHFVVKMYFDGEVTPRIDTDSTTIFGGNYGYFSEPFINTCAGGQVCYEPIGFSESLIIETVNKELYTWSNRHYYQYSYLTFGEEVSIDSYTGELSSEEQVKRSAAIDVFDGVGEHPAGESGSSQQMSVTGAVIQSGGALNFDITGPGVVREFAFDINDVNEVDVFGLRLRVYYDGSDESSIDASIGNFFGAGNERAEYQSISLGTVSADANDGFYCYWPMPFRKSVRFEVSNTTDSDIGIEQMKVEYEPGAVEREDCYLHALEQRTVRDSGQTYHTLVSTAGQGHYVGDLLYVSQDVNEFRMLEGDDVITVDDSNTLNGTGLEDAYNGGAYYNWVAVQGDEPEGEYPQSATRALSGILYVNKGEGFARADQYRWRIADCIAFEESIDVKVECRYGVTNSEWTSVAFWYQLAEPIADLDADGDVDFLDYGRFAEHWQSSDCGYCAGADFTSDGSVDANDLGEFAGGWLAGVSVLQR